MAVGRVVSFLSEHSVEYAIVPRAVSVLKGAFDNVVPLYFWKTREGNGLSAALNADVTVRVLALFPRRPKLADLDDSAPLFGKINSEIFEFSAVASKFGIPVAVGLPLVRNIQQLGRNPRIAWIQIVSGNVDAQLESDVHLMFSEKEGLAALDGLLPESLSMMEELDLPRIISSNSVRLTWHEAAEAMSELRATSEGYRYALRFLGGGAQYRPVYLMVFEDH
ncbi:hypothetical protein [Burkholderia vietnamiensis]|uniref:hypothetical protein n=1 Tax=Burkholderia vietnamiensis TaxID=60552 RepID=UPI000A5D6CAC|nr:hypothetical protein [Burkholderia vietnamiensis]